MLIALGPVVFIAMTLLPRVDSLVFKTASYSESHADQFFEMHEGKLHKEILFRLLLVIHKKILNNVSKLNHTVTSGLDRKSLRFSRTFSQYLTLAFSYFDMILKSIFYFASS